MTENLLVKLEEKPWCYFLKLKNYVLAQRLSMENATFKMEKETNTRKVRI